MNFKNLEGQTTPWIQHLKEYNFTSQHHQGWKHNNADAFSLWPCHEEYTHCHKVEAWAVVKQVQVVVLVAAAGWNPVDLRNEWPGHGALLGGSRDRTAPRRKDIADHSPTYKSYGAPWKSLTLRKGVLECQWESADRWSKIAPIVLPWNRVNDVLTELLGGPWEGHFDVNKTLSKVWER
jgi:hypothetical protein